MIINKIICIIVVLVGTDLNSPVEGAVQTPHREYPQFQKKAKSGNGLNGEAISENMPNGKNLLDSGKLNS